MSPKRRLSDRQRCCRRRSTWSSPRSRSRLKKGDVGSGPERPSTVDLPCRGRPTLNHPRAIEDIGCSLRSFEGLVVAWGVSLSASSLCICASASQYGSSTTQSRSFSSSKKMMDPASYILESTSMNTELRTGVDACISVLCHVGRSTPRVTPLRHEFQPWHVLSNTRFGKSREHSEFRILAESTCLRFCSPLKMRDADISGPPDRPAQTGHL